MGILNVTPDSFSDGGLFDAVDAAVAQARRMREQGAAIIDVGGESTRPGAAPVSAEEEQARVLPVITALAKLDEALISIDTYRAETARMAVEAGAHIVNDVWGLQREPHIAEVAAKTGAGLVIMHTGRGRDKLPDVIADQVLFLEKSLEIARNAGVAVENIVLDPGFGFAKETPEENIELMARFDELHTLGFPLMAGTSRKRFIGHVTGRDAAERDAGTAATSVILRLKGADLFRVHDVAINVDALAIADAMLARGKVWPEMYVIRMKNCAFFARHGVLDEEEALGQRFYVDAALTVDPGPALEADSIEGTVDYGVAFAVIEKIITGERRFLIEALALDVAKALSARFPQIKKAEITVRKPNAPVRGVLDHVEVTVAWPQ